MRNFMMVIAFVVIGMSAASAQTGSGSAGSGSAIAAGSGAQAGKPGTPPPTEGWMPKPPEPTAAELRKICADAMNKDPNFAQAIVETINADTARQHEHAADAIAKNEKHVIMAYGAMWIIAVGFLLFLWRRQQTLKGEIAQLKRDLEAAAK